MSKTSDDDNSPYGHARHKDQPHARDNSDFMTDPDMKAHMSRRNLVAGAAMGAALTMITHAGAANAQAGKPVTLVALGDSLSAGYLLPADAAFPAQLEKALKARGRNITLINAGVSGDTATGGLDRLDWSVPDEASGVIVELGANDALRGLDPDRARQALDAIITRLKARKIGVMLSGMRAPPNLGPDYAARFDSIYPDLASKHGLILDPFFLEGIAGIREFNLPDGIHPTAEGVRRIVVRILPKVERFLDTLPARP
jgi:acyl-CoA thioesterase I